MKLLQKLEEVIAEYPQLDYITISGSGEPTLNSKIGDIIRGIKQMTKVPVAVLTNGTLLDSLQVRQDLMGADVVSSALDAVSPEIFEKIDHPNPQLQIHTIIDGIKMFRKEYRGTMWMEILFVEGINDHDDEVHKMKQVIDKIQPDKVYLNTVVRPPAYSFAKPSSEERLKKIQEILGDRSEVIGAFKERHKIEEYNTNSQVILALLKRRAMTIEQMVISMAMGREIIVALLDQLLRLKAIKSFQFNGEEYFQA